MTRSRLRPSPALLLAICALIVALGGTALAGGVLNKKKVNKIITKRAPGLSVSHASTADSANTAQSAANADSAASVGGVSIQPVLLAAPDPSFVTILDVGGSTVALNCNISLGLELARGVSSPPLTGQWIRDGLSPLVANLPAGSGTSTNGSALGLTATVRQASGHVTRLT